MPDEHEPWPFPTKDHHPPAKPAASQTIKKPSEEAIDHGIEESFPASDPVSVTVSVTKRDGADKRE